MAERQAAKMRLEYQDAEQIRIQFQDEVNIMNTILCAQSLLMVEQKVKYNGRWLSILIFSLKFNCNVLGYEILNSVYLLILESCVIMR